MKSKIFYSCIAVIGILLLLTSCSEPNPNLDESIVPTEKNTLKKASKTLTDVEKAGILFMREEEKMAHDVYFVLNEPFPHRVFQNIIESEQNHTDAVLGLINYYNLVDPVENLGIGEFTDPEIIALYADLIEHGDDSLDSALIVGAIIEETDILDIEELISQTNKKNIINVYSNLLDGSKNHLRAFVKTLAQRKIYYVPRFLTQEEFDAIINE